jgi:hypothetical protein
MSARAQVILGRFPAHLEATRPGKQLEAVTAALARDLDVDAAAMAGIRRAHRLGEADQLRDLLLIAGLHGITRPELALLFIRFDRATALLAALEGAADPAERDALAERLIALWGVEAEVPRLPSFAPPDDPAAPPEAAIAGLAVEVRNALRHRHLLDALRTRIGRICAIHAGGNGTVSALLHGGADALDLDIAEIEHSDDRYWHAAVVHDRLRLARPVLEPGTPDQPDRVTSQPFAPAEEVIGIEENPLWRFETDKVGRRHGELFSVLRRGFERALLQVRVTGQEGRTIGPMLVNRDEGRGVGFAGPVPAGETLVLDEEGRAKLDGDDVTALAFSWKGACFAGLDLRPDADFVFDGPGVDPDRRAVFVETVPAGALDRDFVFPHSGDSITMPGIGIGEARFAFFVQQGHWSLFESAVPPPGIRRVTPRTAIAFADGSVFAAAAGETPPVAAELSLSWLERRAFAVRMIVPSRFRDLEDDPEGADTRKRLALAVRRFRPAGVEVTVDFIQENWILGESVLAGDGPQGPIDRLRTGTALWSPPEGEG